MIAIVGLDHIVLRTTKIEAMLNFYCKLLSCPIERTLPELGLTQLRAGNCLIDIVEVDSELGKLGGKAPNQNGRNLDHFCLQIEPIQPSVLIAWLQNHQLTFSPPAERYGAQGFGESIYVDDPEGNVVELKPRKESL